MTTRVKPASKPKTTNSVSAGRIVTAGRGSKAYREVEFILTAAHAAGFRVGAAPDGSEMIVIQTVKLPFETAKWFATKLYEFRELVIELINTQQNGAQTGEIAPDAVEAEGVSS
jgi:hypothetical protein